MFTRAMRWVYIGFTWLFLAGIVIQFYLAGYAVFSRVEDFEIHRNFGMALGGLALVGFLLSFAARVPWSVTGWRFVLFLQIAILQSLFAGFRVSNPAIGAFHVVNAVAICAISVYLTIASRGLIAQVGTKAGHG